MDPDRRASRCAAGRNTMRHLLRLRPPSWSPALRHRHAALRRTAPEAAAADDRRRPLARPPAHRRARAQRPVRLRRLRPDRRRRRSRSTAIGGQRRDRPPDRATRWPSDVDSWTTVRRRRPTSTPGSVAKALVLAQVSRRRPTRSFGGVEPGQAAQRAGQHDRADVGRIEDAARRRLRQHDRPGLRRARPGRRRLAEGARRRPRSCSSSSARAGFFRLDFARQGREEAGAATPAARRHERPGHRRHRARRAPA